MLKYKRGKDVKNAPRRSSGVDDSQEGEVRNVELVCTAKYEYVCSVNAKSKNVDGL